MRTDFGDPCRSVLEVRPQGNPSSGPENEGNRFRRGISEQDELKLQLPSCAPFEITGSSSDRLPVIPERAVLRTHMKAMQRASERYRAGDMASFYETLTASAFRVSNTSVTLANPELPDCPIVDVSRGFEQLTGYRRSEIVGRNCRWLNKGCPMCPESRVKLREASRQQKKFVGILTNRRKNGEVFQNLLVMSPLRIGNQFYLLAIQADVTNADVDLTGEQDRMHEELNEIVDAIFASIVNAWVAMHSHLDMLPLTRPVPYVEHQLRVLYQPEVYEQAKQQFVVLAPAEAPNSTRLSYVNTFLQVVDSTDEAGNKSSSGLFRRSYSEPSLNDESSRIGGSKRLPEEVLRESLRYLEAGQGPGPVARPRQVKDVEGRVRLAEEPLASEGSGLHPNGCTPCSFFCYSLAGCNKGSDCSFCHNTHPRRPRRRGKGKKNLAEAEFEDSAIQKSHREQTSANVGFRQAEAAPTPPALLPLLSALEVLAPLPDFSLDLLARARDHAMGASAMLDADMDDFLPRADMSQAAPASSSRLRYSESCIVLELKQCKQVVPFIGRASGPLVFSVDPPFPSGLSVHRTSGVISGVALQLTRPDGSRHIVAMTSKSGVQTAEIRVLVLEPRRDVNDSMAYLANANVRVDNGKDSSDTGTCGSEGGAFCPAEDEQ